MSLPRITDLDTRDRKMLLLVDMSKAVAEVRHQAAAAAPRMNALLFKSMVAGFVSVRLREAGLARMDRELMASAECRGDHVSLVRVCESNANASRS